MVRPGRTLHPAAPPGSAPAEEGRERAQRKDPHEEEATSPQNCGRVRTRTLWQIAKAPGAGSPRAFLRSPDDPSPALTPRHLFRRARGLGPSSTLPYQPGEGGGRGEGQGSRDLGPAA